MELLIFCPKCGRRGDGDRFCRGCGTNLAAVSKALAHDNPAGVSRRATNLFAVFSTRKLAGPDLIFEGRKFSSIFGELKLDLTEAEIPPGETRIDLYSVLGNIEILLPLEIGLRVSGMTVLAESKVDGVKLADDIFNLAEYRSPNYEMASRRLYVHISSVLANLKVERC